MIRPGERLPLWRRLGFNTEGLSIEEALRVADADYEVGIVPLVASVPDRFLTAVAQDEMRVARPVPRKNLTYRKDTGEPIAPVGARYHVVQTREVISLIEAMTGGGWKPEFTGTFNHGSAVFMVGKLDMALMNHEIDPYLCFVNSFDGSTGVKFVCTPFRIACTNQIRAIYNRSKHARPVVSLRHTTNILKRAETTREVLGLTRAYYQYLDHQIEMLMDMAVSEQLLGQVLDTVAPIAHDAPDYVRERKEAKRAQIVGTLRESPTIDNNLRGTAWGLYNAVTEIEQWGRDQMPTQAQSEKLFGNHLGMVPMTNTSDRVMKLLVAQG